MPAVIAVSVTHFVDKITIYNEPQTCLPAKFSSTVLNKNTALARKFVRDPVTASSTIGRNQTPHKFSWQTGFLIEYYGRKFCGVTAVVYEKPCCQRIT